MIDIGQMNAGRAAGGFDFARTGEGGPGRWTVAVDADSVTRFDRVEIKPLHRPHAHLRIRGRHTTDGD